MVRVSEALSMVVDVSDGEQIEVRVRRAVDEWRRLDVLMQNAYRGDTSHEGSTVKLSEEG
jgi:NADP-dependent 3-hydroxy acid dehydrogenase YdfG